MLGTIRRDGSPRISPVEPCIRNGGLLVGAMTWSAKAADLRRDPRYALHSAVTNPDSGEGELKLHGRGVAAGPALSAQAAQAWWAPLPPDQAIVFALAITQALFGSWDLERGVMTVHRSARAGYPHSTRNHPLHDRQAREYAPAAPMTATGVKRRGGSARRLAWCGRGGPDYSSWDLPRSCLVHDRHDRVFGTGLLGQGRSAMRTGLP